MEKIKAKIVADSINQQGDRITTYLLTYPRFIHGELLTHRVFSKNSASSRAIPFEKMVKMVETDPFIPIAWQRDHKGMQGTEYLNKEEVEKAELQWIQASRNAVNSARMLNSNYFGVKKNLVTKQLCNRLLEPFMWHTVLLTGTEFKNFFELRCPKYQYNLYMDNSPAFKSKKDFYEHYEEVGEKDAIWFLKHNLSQAEIHIQALAEAMWDAMNESIPKTLQSGEWHIPFGDRIDEEKIKDLKEYFSGNRDPLKSDDFNYRIKISTARCARLSYMTFDGEIDYEKDLKLHDTLLESQHMSPFEHCAKAMSNEEYYSFIKGKGTPEHLSDALYFNSNCRGWCNNFKGFIQYRYLIENYYDEFKM